ncbi:hypothetical protein BCR32DRAFT_326960 [Anaeromyces robustus]|uniref:Glycosyltransferase family 17 protein n=1 Tax=Anaeromyces robustus TaxID=1754192 RepID=A0A1Y1X8T6_9FUNG|nr:hypothetical protein BCR32DRAFT_326960 [Anaeromyces robustus]|eukprot:ORX82175.1 hypothetical protein BCR32DRAFT_326960 [Anaeromyces robustus]
MDDMDDMDDVKYQLLGNSNITKKNQSKLKKYGKKITIILLSIVILIIVYLYYQTYIPNYEKILIKGESRKDQYGIDLNQYVLNGIYSMGYDGDINKKFEDWSLYTPQCPDLEPAQYPENIRNPKCEETSLQFGNLYVNHGKSLPFSLPLNSITNQLNQWKDWEKNNKDKEPPYYYEMSFKDSVTDEYHPFDYGYQGPDTSEISDQEYYSQVIKSRMDEVPDPRRRRLFFFILFNNEFDLLDLHISEYYDVVDYFVIYEANSTFTGGPKPLSFTRTLLETNRYDKFKDKLIPLPLTIEVNDKDTKLGKTFPRERVARRVLIEKGLRAVEARHGDIFVHGDLDEFPKANILYRMKKCGGWEHLQMGIGGGPKSFKDTNIKSYFVDKNMNIEIDDRGSYKVDYQRAYSLGFMGWFYEYSFHIINNDDGPGITRPNLLIFDARRSLGQLPERINSKPKNNNNNNNKNKNKNKRKEEIEEVKREKEGEHIDVLLDPNFDPYQGYTYSNNTNYQFNGKGYIAENIRLSIASFYENVRNANTTLLWNGGWHLSTFLPNLDIAYNKVMSYSHSDSYRYLPKFIGKNLLKYRINRPSFIYGSFERLKNYIIKLPQSYLTGYQYNFETNYWKEMIKNNGTDSEFKEYVNVLTHDVPYQVWKNPICYNYMLDRDYGINKKLWWDYIPKEKWNNFKFKDLELLIINDLLPKNITGTYKDEYIKTLKGQ